MHGWVECIPNFSEGQNSRLIAELEAVVRSVAGVVFLRSDPSPDHNRTVFTFAGPGRAVRKAAFNLIRGAMERIDLTRHIGVHPRMGAVDVVPFVPLGTTTMEQAAELARGLGEEVGAKLQLPVFLYEESAPRADRRSLAALRKGGFEGHLADGYPVGPPDFGPSKPHSAAGSVAIGARFFIVAFNVILDTNELDIARDVARAVRESSRGLPAVRALGLPLPSQGLVQIAINILDYRLTSLTQVMERVREEARRMGTAVLESELIGLVPRAALTDSVWELLRLPPRRRERVIEDAVEKSGAFTFAERLAAATPTPGSGAAAARAALHATSLLRMVAGITLDRLPSGDTAGREGSSSSGADSDSAHSAVSGSAVSGSGVSGSGGSAAAELEGTLKAVGELGKRFRALEVEDEEAFERFLDARSAARAAAAATAGKGASTAAGEAKEKAAASARAITVSPLKMLEGVTETLRFTKDLLETAERHSLNLRAGSDLGGAVELLRACARTASLNVQINLPQLSRQEAAGLEDRRESLLMSIDEECDRLAGEIHRKFIKG